MFGQRNGENKAPPDGCGWLCSEDELPFSRCPIVETLKRSFIVEEDEIVLQPSLQLMRRVILFECNVLTFNAAPYAFAKDIVEGATAADYADLDAGRV